MPSQVDGNFPPFARTVRALMREQRITIDALSRKADIGWRQIARYRTGDAEPRDSFGDPTPNAHKLAEALGVPVAELVPPRERNSDTTAAA